MGLLYRFRKNRDYSINNLFSFRIEGSKYTEMADEREVSLSINVESLCKITNLDKSVIAKFNKIIREHIINSYYISFFTTIDQTDDLSMWNEYAGGDGFCLVYDEQKIKNAIKITMLTYRNKYLIFRDVDYGNEPTDITSFAHDFLSLVGDDTDNEEAYKKAAETVGNNLSSSEVKRLTKCMFHKIGTFPEKSEKRIVLLGKKHDKAHNNDMISVVVKPVKIICSSSMPIATMDKIQKFAKKNSIQFAIKQL